MSDTLVDTVPIYPPDRFSFSPVKCIPRLPTTSDDPRPSSNPRKREGSRSDDDCVKRRDSLVGRYRDLDLVSNVPCCESFSHQCEEALSVVEAGLVEHNMEDSSSLTDSGFDSSKSSSPVHNSDVNFSSNQDDGEEEKKMGATKSDSLEAQSITAAKDLCSLQLSESFPKDPIIPSLFKDMPSVVYFCTVDEAVHPMPEETVPLLKWKLSTITPLVIKKIVQKMGFVLLEADTKDDWIGTWGKHLKCSTFKEIKNFQKVNHFPGGFQMGHKDKLWVNYRRMVSKFGKEEFNFFPHTYVLPADLKALKLAWGKKCWIMKPCASARGSGVKVIYKWSQVPKNSPMVIQRYIRDPYLINGSKFDLRIYVLISSVKPLRIYLFKDGLVRFASQKYSLSQKSFGNRYIHLTNYSINRKSSTYTSNDDETLCQGHKWSLKSFWQYMSNSGINVEKIQETIKDLIIKTVICTERRLCRMLRKYAHKSYNCFELFGFDVMLDKNLHPWLLEVNVSPSLHTKSMLDHNVKGQLVKDTLNIAGYEIPSKSADPDHGVFLGYKSNRHKPLNNQGLTKEEREKHDQYSYSYGESYEILQDLTMDDIHCLMESEDEFQRRGEFERIFPSPESQFYLQYFESLCYYNVLLDAWERMTAKDNREEGVKYLQAAYDRRMKSSSEKKETTDLLKSPQESTENAVNQSNESETMSCGTAGCHV